MKRGALKCVEAMMEYKDTFASIDSNGYLKHLNVDWFIGVTPDAFNRVDIINDNTKPTGCFKDGESIKFNMASTDVSGENVYAQ